mmetsp:Transcript_139342/g.253469  ORF Transcript_139342/g.253469 Transcript_139342/m.253469 type:complete len:385 (+) Transcript_139342:78-1232(+)
MKRRGCLAQTCRLVPAIFFLAIQELVLGYTHSESCEAPPSNSGGGLSLLQARRMRSRARTWIEGRKIRMPAQSQAPKSGAARALLPPHVFDLGMQLLFNEEVLDYVVANTDTWHSPYAGVNITWRMVNGDYVDMNDVYGVDSLHKISNTTDMLTMLDLGGNYGRVSTAAYKNYPGKMRIVVVEPIPSTYFLLRWNLWLNGVPELTLEEFQDSPDKAGVLALNSGLSKLDGESTEMCYIPPETMTARICNCSHGFTNRPGEQCAHIKSRSIGSLLGLLNHSVSFLKMDCEGCEIDVLPTVARLTQESQLKIGRFAGELHALPNDLEDVACKAEGGQWFVHICFLKGVQLSVDLPERCQQQSDREGCNRTQWLQGRPLEGIPPSEW